MAGFNKKSQVEMAQSVAVLFVFFILVAFGISKYSSMQISSLKASQDESSSLRAVEAGQSLSFLPEFECSINSVSKEFCIDTLKLKYFVSEYNRTQENREYYQSLFGRSTVWVTQIYPKNITWQVYNDTPPQDSSLHQRLFIIPTKLYNPLSNYSEDLSFGILYVEVYLA